MRFALICIIAIISSYITRKLLTPYIEQETILTIISFSIVLILNLYLYKKLVLGEYKNADKIINEKLDEIEIRKDGVYKTFKDLTNVAIHLEKHIDKLTEIEKDDIEKLKELTKHIREGDKYNNIEDIEKNINNQELNTKEEQEKYISDSLHSIELLQESVSSQMNQVEKIRDEIYKLYEPYKELSTLKGNMTRLFHYDWNYLEKNINKVFI